MVLCTMVCNKWGQSKIAGSFAGGKNGGDFTLTPDIVPSVIPAPAVIPANAGIQ